MLPRAFSNQQWIRFRLHYFCLCLVSSISILKQFSAILSIRLSSFHRISFRYRHSSSHHRRFGRRQVAKAALETPVNLSMCVKRKRRYDGSRNLLSTARKLRELKTPTPKILLFLIGDQRVVRIPGCTRFVESQLIWAVLALGSTFKIPILLAQSALDPKFRICRALLYSLIAVASHRPVIYKARSSWHFEWTSTSVFRVLWWKRIFRIE